MAICAINVTIWKADNHEERMASEFSYFNIIASISPSGLT